MHRELTAKFLKDELSKMIELFPEEKRATVRNAIK